MFYQCDVTSYVSIGNRPHDESFEQNCNAKFNSMLLQYLSTERHIELVMICNKLAFLRHVAIYSLSVIDFS
jgi:hypothetical protein